LLFKFAFKYVIRKFQTSQEGLQLKCKVSVIILLWESTNNLQKNIEHLLFARNGIGIGISAEKTKNLFMNPEKNSG